MEASIANSVSAPWRVPPCRPDYPSTPTGVSSVMWPALAENRLERLGAAQNGWRLRSKCPRSWRGFSLAAAPPGTEPSSAAFARTAHARSRQSPPLPRCPSRLGSHRRVGRRSCPGGRPAAAPRADRWREADIRRGSRVHPIRSNLTPGWPAPIGTPTARRALLLIA
jgi:hypothetical protein